MELGLTAEQLELKDELRSYFVGLVDEVEGSDDGEPTYTRYIRRMGEDGWLGSGLAGGVRRPGPGADRPDDLRRGVPLGRRARSPSSPSTASGPP